MFCTQCGGAVPAGARFCNNCGSEVAISNEVSRSVGDPADSTARTILYCPMGHGGRYAKECSVCGRETWPIPPEPELISSKPMPRNNTLVSGQKEAKDKDSKIILSIIAGFIGVAVIIGMVMSNGQSNPVANCVTFTMSQVGSRAGTPGNTRADARRLCERIRSLNPSQFDREWR